VVRHSAACSKWRKDIVEMGLDDITDLYMTTRDGRVLGFAAAVFVSILY
jgi:hypothetical protein